MTNQGAIRVLEDGTRIYADGHRYKPKPPAERKNQSRRPDHQDAVRFHGQWFVPLDVLPDGERRMPETRPDTDAYDHASKPRSCRCAVCQRPEARRWKEKWMRDQGLTAKLNETPRQRKRRLRIQRARRDMELALRRGSVLPDPSARAAAHP